MIDIYIPDPLRAKVEAESAGKRTILYSKKKQPNYMYVVPQFKLTDVAVDLGNRIHPAFIVNEEIKDAFFYSCYPGSIHQGELLSVPNVEPASQMDLMAFQQLAQQTGKGFHLSTNTEWSALMLWCRHHQMREAGNTDYGRNFYQPEQSVKRIDKGIIGDVNGLPTSYTSPRWADWYHDNTLNGISDLCGNLWEWQAGMRLVAG